MTNSQSGHPNSSQWRRAHFSKAVRRVGLSLCGICILLAFSARADDARLPYRQLYYAQKLEAEFNRVHTNLFMALTVQSTLPGVPTADLRMYIAAKAGKIPVDVGAAGALSVPLRDDLLAEDPWVVANQPKGTMKLSWQAGVLPGPIANSVHYARLMQPVQDLQDVQETLRQLIPGSPKLTMTGLKLTFPDSAKRAVAIIHAKGGSRKIEANENHEIILPLAADLLKEDPEISLSEPPGAVEFVSRQNAE